MTSHGGEIIAQHTPCQYCPHLTNMSSSEWPSSSSAPAATSESSCTLCRIAVQSRSTLQSARQRRALFPSSSDFARTDANPLPEPVADTSFDDAFDGLHQFMTFASRQCGRYHGNILNGGKTKSDPTTTSSSVSAKSNRAHQPGVTSSSRNHKWHQSKKIERGSSAAPAPGVLSSGKTASATERAPLRDLHCANVQPPVSMTTSKALHHYDRYHSQRHVRPSSCHGNPLQSTTAAGSDIRVQVAPGTYAVTAGRWGQEGRRIDTHVVDLDKDQCVQITFAM